mmetsp:Transcript_13718/g.15627  ORF Transcript_13718/g.15627 Transcript_13718/m.15627 type:complete len:87 (-) Transcript_13718:338-598(-)
MADFKGQKLCETIYQRVLLFFSLIGFLIGFLFEDFGYTVKILGFGLAIATVLCVPDWGMYNQNPIDWVGRKKPQTVQTRKAKGKAK